MCSTEIFRDSQAATKIKTAEKFQHLVCVNGSFLAAFLSSQTPTLTLSNLQVSDSQLSYSLIYTVIKGHRRILQIFQEIPDFQFLKISVQEKREKL